MASHFSSRTKSQLPPLSKRNLLRRVLVETLDKRELLAADLAGPVFAPGTPQDYVDSVIAQYMGSANSGANDGGAGNINLVGSRWENPTGGVSPNMGDPATVSWSLVPDGTTDGTNGSATNLIAFMDSIYGGGTGAVDQRPWFGLFERAYDRWSEVSGLTFVYEANDDGAAIGGANRGVTGVRGDVRIGGRAIDGNSGILAFNYVPNGGGDSGFDGDMIIDTNDVFYFNNADGPTGENRALSNVLLHESGHGIGLDHVIPVNQTKLLEPFISTAYLGPQHDDILAAQALYGDNLENSDTQATAHDLGNLLNGNSTISGNSIDRAADDDWYQFTLPSTGELSISVTPQGEQYDVGPQGGTSAPVNTLTNLDLSFELVASDGTVLAQVNNLGVGEAETLDDFAIGAGGTFFVRVIGSGAATAEPQMYDMNIRARGFVGSDANEEPPHLLSVSPNVGEIFSFNRTNELELSPNELVFRFDGAQLLDADSLDGIRVMRSGFDGDFTDGDEVTITPGFIGFGDSDRVVVARFAESLPDDMYRVEVFGTDIPAEGITAVRNVDGTPLEPRIAGTDRDTIFFDLELGANIVAIVPQPTSRAAGGSLSQARDQIQVFFNEDDLYTSAVATGDVTPNPTVVDPSYYRLYSDKGSIANTDDELFLPTSVEYDPARNLATLTFAGNIDELDASANTSFRLRIGTNESRPGTPIVVSQATDPASTFRGAAGSSSDLGVFNSLTSIEFEESITNSEAFPIDFPGAQDTPGDREVFTDPAPGEAHLLSDTPDTDVNLTVQHYTFNSVLPFGTTIDGQPLTSSITAEQQQRFREVFEFYGSVLGVDFIETDQPTTPSGDSVWWLTVGPIDGPSGTLGQAGGSLLTMDAAESWQNEFGANDDPTKFSFFVVGMHEVGHLLGLGHASELPPGTLMGGLYGNDTLGGEPSFINGTMPRNLTEPVFPGPHDTVHAQYLHRPDSRDIDMYRFEVAAGNAGEFTAEVVAERLADSSLLDSVLTLYREMPDGTREVVAVNDDYFSEDSYMKLNLQPGTYYLGVTASGNSGFDPEIEDSGLGGTSEGDYKVRVAFRPLEAASITDASGTPIDGDADGTAGGVMNFWFNAAAPSGQETNQSRTLFVDKTALPQAGPLGTLANPFNSIDTAFAAAQPGDVVRIVANGGTDDDVATANNNVAYEIGRGGLGNAVLADGETMEVPQGVTVMVDAGVLFKMGASTIGVGSSTAANDRSQASLQILGTPEQSVLFTSFTDETLGVDNDPLTTTANPGDWGGVVFRNAVDRAEGRFDAEIDGQFTNFVAFADMRHGGGRVNIDGQAQVIAPIHMDSARPTLLNNTITKSASSAMSADPNSFQETTFRTPRFQEEQIFSPDYSRVGPDIHGNTVVDNSVNGLFVRVSTAAGQATQPQTVAGRWDDADIVHVVADTLTIQGTPGGPRLETAGPSLNSVQLSDQNVAGGQLVAGTQVSYRMTFVDNNGIEAVASAATQQLKISAGNNAVRLAGLPVASNGFVARRLYRSTSGGTFQLVAELDRSSNTYVDALSPQQTQLNAAATLHRARLDASLVVDPGLVVKLQSGRISAGISAQVVAEGSEGLPVIFTSRQDDTYGAGGTFDTNSDLSQSAPQPGDWGGLYFGQLGSGSLDHALVSYAGGVVGVNGTFAGFNPIEIHQSTVRIANTTIENNASGVGGAATENREGFGFNEPAAIFVRGSQPIIVDNIIRSNAGAAISIDPVSMTGDSVRDHGRSTGMANQMSAITENKGPLLRGNALGENDTNGLLLRGATLVSESVWDDADIVHTVFDEILVPDFHVYGGLRLQSSPNESLVVKFGPDAGLTSHGRPLDIDDRIGGTLQVIGTPGFPVILTSVADDTIGAGFDPDGRAQLDTNNDDTGSTPGRGDWRSLRIDAFSNDRNVAAVTELEPAQSTGAGVNGEPARSQSLGLLAADEKSGDDNLRLGYVVSGVINNIDDIDVYSFSGTAGSTVWLDVDRTDIGLDAVVELVDSNGNIIAQSNNSFDEANNGAPLFANPAAIAPQHVSPMQTNIFSPRNFGDNPSGTFADFYSVNPLDPGMRVSLPGASGSQGTYFVRVRSSNIDSRDPAANPADLQDASKLNDGLTEGQYQLQIRLRETNEVAGSSINYADIRYATDGIEVLGQPAHSPLVGEAVELNTNNDAIANALDLGNLLNTDRAALSIAGSLQTATDIDWYSFDINQPSIQDSGLTQHLSTIIDVDYADGLGRANTSLWLFYDDQNGLGNGAGIKLVNFALDSNIADDQAAPINGTDVDDLSRGSAGVLDAFLGATALPSGTYHLAITSNQQMSGYLQQFFAPDAGGNPLTRVEPINSVTRIAEDHFDGGQGTFAPPLEVAFTAQDAGVPNKVGLTLADIPLFISQRRGNDTSELISVSGFTGSQIAGISSFPYVEDIAIRGDGTIHGARSPQTGVINDANSGGILDIDVAGDGATAAVTTTSGIQTFELDTSVAPPAVAQALTPGTGGQRQGRGMEFLGLTYPQDGNTQFLYAVGQRTGVDSFLTFNGLTDANNYVYKLDPTSLQAISAPGADRQDGARLAGAGTQIAERGYIDTSVDTIANQTYQTIIMDAASPANAPALLDGDTVTISTPTGNVTFTWTAAVLSGTLIADTVPQSQVNNFPPAPQNFFTDGDVFSLTVGANTTTFEIDTGRVIENNYVTQTAPATYDGSTFTVVDADGDIVTFEMEATGGVTAPNIPVAYDAANATRAQVSAAIVAAINNATVDPTNAYGDGAWGGSAALLPGTDRISIEGDASVVLGAFAGAAPAAGAWTNSTALNPLTISELTISNAPVPFGQTRDGATIEITDLDGDTYTFEFDTDGSVTGTNVPVPIQDNSTQAFIGTALQSAINFPNGAADPAWNVTAGAPSFNGVIRLDGDASVVISPSGVGFGSVVNPVTGSSEYGAEFAPTNTLVPIEEFYTNLDDTQFLPTPSTPGAMDVLVSTINTAAIGVTASGVGTRLVLAGADAADFTAINTITSNASNNPANELPFGFNDSALVLNQTLLTALQTIVPEARFTADGRIQLPAANSFVQGQTDDRGDTPSRNARLSEPQYGLVTGLAYLGANDAMYAVSDQGDLYRVGGTAFSANSRFNNGDFIDTIYDDFGQRVQFTSLTFGPARVEEGRFAQTLFGIDAAGVLYAFDTQGRPVAAFNEGAWSVQTAASNPSGLTFANLDVNLWHLTDDNRQTDDGHGINVSFDGSRRAQAQGDNSLYFGLEDPNNSDLYQFLTDGAGNLLRDFLGNPIPVDGFGADSINDPGANFPGYDATVYDSYDFAGGAKGSVVSAPLDLSTYSPADKPFLYFNYYLATEAANSDLNDNDYMQDAFRVFVSGDDGQWSLLATNNSERDTNRLDFDDEFDTPFGSDPFNANTKQVSELYDVGDASTGTTVPDSWRQARVDLSRFAGDELVRVRFDFSSAGTFDVGPVSAGGIELQAVPGDRLQPVLNQQGDAFEPLTFEIVDNVSVGNTVPTVFEFDHGLVLQIPSGAALSAGQTFEVEGVKYSFATNNVGNNVQISATDTGEDIANRIVTKLLARGLSAHQNPGSRNVISVMDATNATPSIDSTLPANFVLDVPGLAVGTQQVLVNAEMTYQEVREAMRVSLARAFNVAGQETNTSTIKFHDRSIYLWDKAVPAGEQGPLGVSQALEGDAFGVPQSGSFTNPGGARGQNNRFEGVYVDDIIVGFAERGEMVTYEDNGTAVDTSFVANPWHEPTADFGEIETGTYQIEIRRGPTFGIGGENFPELGLFRSFDTNDRTAETISLVAPAGYQIADGQTFTLSDGVETVQFEWDDTTITVGSGVGVAQGNVRIPFDPADTNDTIAGRIEAAVNSTSVQSTINIVAGRSDGSVGGAILGKASGSHIVNLHGAVASDNRGGADFSGPNFADTGTVSEPGAIIHGYGYDPSAPLDNVIQNQAISDNGDSNRFRDQGQIIIHSNVIRDSANFGIVVDAGARIDNILTPLAGILPHPGAVRNLLAFNQEDLVPGPVLINNLVYANAVGGILFSGDSRTAASPEAPVPFGRLVNNTVVGLNGAGIGINVTENASPTLLNNIVSSLATGIQVDNTSTTTVVGATTYHQNTNDIGGALGNRGTDPQIIAASEPMFVDAAGRNYYLAPGSRAIDSALDSLNDRQAMTTVRSPLGIAVSPILAPDRDLTGQLRVDDPAVSNPNGTGANPFKDRGAYDSADFFGPVAVIQQPLDNDPDNIDVDRFNTFIRLTEGVLDSFSILLVEPEGTGPDARTVTADSVTLTQNGQLLEPGVDYIFGYNPSSRLIRLTPLAGIWRSDSVYEITLNNQAGLRVDAGDGSTLADGQTFTVDAGGSSLLFEFDSDGSVAAGSIAVPFEPTYSSYQVASQIVAATNAAGVGMFAYLQGDGRLMIHGANSISDLPVTSVGAIRDVAGNELQANRVTSLTQFTIVMPEVEFDYGDAGGANSQTLQADNGARHALLPVDVPLLALGAFADAELDGQPNATALGDDEGLLSVSSTITGIDIVPTGSIILEAAAATAAIDGTTFTIVDPALKVAVFEFDTAAGGGSVAAGNIRVAVAATATADQVAAAVRDAVNSAVQSGVIGGLIGVANGDRVSLGGTRDHNFVTAPSLTRLPAGEVNVTLPNSGYADGQTLSVDDGRGSTIVFEIDDNPTGLPASVVVPNVPVTVDLANDTPEQIASKFGDAINLTVAARNLRMGAVSVAGTVIEFNGDDEDGVSFGGIFNSNLEPVPITVTATGAGVLDAWVDWNNDGDFADTGERVTKDLSVQGGENVIYVQTPANAVIGATTSRFRISTTGNLSVGGLALGGEVEDHLIEVVSGLPPVAVDDNYTVVEDGSLSISSPGILANDTDADSPSITVLDQNPLTPEVDPVENVAHGTLVLNTDGSFTYTPDPDFFGEDVFVYNAFDSRLQSALPATVTITVTPVNDRPTAIDDQVTILEDELLVRPGGDFTANDFKGVFGTPSQTNELGQDLTIVGAVIMHPDPSVYGGSVSVVNNEITYTPPAHYNDAIDGPALVELTIRDSGVAGADAMPLEHTSTLTINLTPVNDAPEFTMPATTGTTEDAGAVVVDNFLTDLRPGPTQATDEATGPAIVAEDQQTSYIVRALDPTQFAVLPAIGGTTDTSPGQLTYQLAADVNTITPFDEVLVEVIAVDTGATGGANSDVNTSAPQTFTILPTPINDAPEFTILDEVDSLEDEGVITVADFLTDLRPGPASAVDEIPQILTVSIAADPNAFTATGYPAIDLTTGVLTYETAPHVNQFTGQSFVVDVTVIDDGGTNLGGIDRTTKPFTINVTELNDAPEFDMPVVTSAFQEDPNADPMAPTVVPGFASNIMPGPVAANDEGPALEDQQVSFAVRALDETLFDLLPTIDASGQLTYRLNTDVNQMVPFPAILVEVIASDTGANDGGTNVPRNINTADARTFTILPDPINDAPEFTIPATIDATEDSGAVTVADFVIDARPGPLTALDELAAQTTAITVEALDPTAFSTQPSIVLDPITGTGVLSFETAADVNVFTGHDLRVRVTLMDDGGVTNPGDVDTTIKTFSINVAPINDAPSFVLPVAEVTVLEDEEEVSGTNPTVIPGFATNILAGPTTALDETTNAGTAQSVSFVTVSVSDESLFAVQPRITPTGDLTFETAQDQNGQAIVVVHLLDDGVGMETTNGDDNQSRPDQTFTINITSVNDAPEFTIPATANSQEDQGFVSIPNFATGIRPGPVTAADEAGQDLTIQVIAADPSAFSVQPEIAIDGTLTFQTAPDVNSLNANLGVTVVLTDGNDPTPPVNLSTTKSFTLLTNEINDEPIFNLATPTVEVIEDVEDFEGTTITSIPAFATDMNPGPLTATDEVGQTLNFEVVSVSAPELFEQQPLISQAGELTFETAQHKNGKAVIVVRLVDDGVSNPAPNDNTSRLQTFTISVTPVNDAPEFALPNAVTVIEDAGLVSRSQFATNVRRGPVGSEDENSQLITFDVVALDPSAFAVQPAIGVDGTLTFQTAQDANSLNADLRVVATLRDSGADSPAPNVNVSDTKTFTLTVTPVNDAPTTDSYTIIGEEDTQLIINPADVLVGDVAGPTPDELGQTLRLTQVARTSLNGGSVTPIFGDASDPTKVTSIEYLPPANLAGSDEILYVVTDDGSPERSGTGTITVAISGINDAPQFTRGADVIAPEDAGDVEIASWATNILAGPPSALDELLTQSVNFTVTATDPSLFAVQPAISSDGTLSFTPATDANGTSSVTVQAVDDGPTGGLNVNVSPTQTFSLRINPVNDAPVFTAGDNVAVDEDSGLFTVAWASDIAAAAGLLNTPQTATDESGQGLDFNLAVDRPELFSVQPAINATGELTFTPQSNAFGDAVVTVTLVDRGPANPADENTSLPSLLTISINPENDQPVAVEDSYNTTEDGVLNVAATGLLTNDTDVDLPLDSLKVVAGDVTSTSGVTVTLNEDGSFTYDASSLASFQQLQAGQSIFDRFTYTIEDTAGTVSEPATVTIRVDGADDAPIANDDNYAIGAGNSIELAILENDTDVDSTINPQTISVTANPAFGSVTVLGIGVVRYTPDAGFRGSDSFRYTVRDSAGNISNEAIVTVTVNSAPNAADDSAITFKGEPIDINVLANDSDPDGSIDPSTVSIEQSSPNGIVEVQSDGTVRFTPTSGFAGGTTFRYSVRDDVGTPSNVATVTVQVLNSKWQNPSGFLDVNADGSVSPIDALIVINYLNSGQETNLTLTDIVPAPYLDPTGDERVAPNDVLAIINFLNQNSGGAGEGEASDNAGSIDYAMLVTPQQVIETVGPQIVKEIQDEMDILRQAALSDSAASTNSDDMLPAFDDNDEEDDIASCLHDEFGNRLGGNGIDDVDDFFSGYGPQLP